MTLVVMFKFCFRFVPSCVDYVSGKKRGQCDGFTRMQSKYLLRYEGFSIVLWFYDYN